MAVEGTQVRVLMPTPLYEELKDEAENAGTTMADLVRIAVAERSRRQKLLQRIEIDELRGDNGDHKDV